tara:strand:- start:271 stop:618 length:348 start_codon:yes stop_codon:yes gene_type:complete
MTLYKLNKKTKNELINNIIKNNKVIIYYHSKKCPYCIMIDGLLTEIFKKYEKDINVIIISVERDNIDLLEKKKRINLVPSFISYKKGIKKMEFRKKREYENIVNFIEKNKNEIII